jgi:hypothetical protein
VKVDLTYPIPHVVEALFRGTVISQDYPHGAFVIGLCDGAESLLASSIPNLQLHILPIDIDRLYLKVNS